MNYAEFPAPEGLRYLVKAAWTLAAEGKASETMRHVATPDGCIEVIFRAKGRSQWHAEQPAAFVAGLSTRPAELCLSGDSEFIGLRLWPWTWNLIGHVHSRSLLDCWAALSTAAPDFPTLASVPGAFASLDPRLMTEQTKPLIDAILTSSSVADIAERSGRSHRWLQRWFERHVGVSPRIYLRLLRFSNAFERLPGSNESLADHAAEHGFADQSHMAREFRSMSGSSAGKAKNKAIGPFL